MKDLLVACLEIWKMCNDHHVQIKQAMIEVCSSNELDFNAIRYHYYQIFRKSPAYFVHHRLNNKLTFAQETMLILVVQSYARELTPMSTEDVRRFVEQHFRVEGQ